MTQTRPARPERSEPARPAPANRLAGRRVVVVGGARGTGAAIARACAAEGAVVAVLDRDADAVRRVADEFERRAWVADLDDPVDTRETMEKVLAWLGRIDVLVNNPGASRFGSILGFEPDGPAEHADAFAMPTRTMLVATRVAARAMIAFRAPSSDVAGKVVNVAGMGSVGAEGQAHYAAAKASVTALTRAAAHELGPQGITVNCLCTGPMREEMDPAERLPGRLATWSALSPLGRLAEPRDVARAVVFLASGDSDYLTGEVLTVSGGMALH